jgi:hypothetical protein
MPASPAFKRLSRLQESAYLAGIRPFGLYEFLISQRPIPSGIPMRDGDIAGRPITPPTRPAPTMVVETYSPDWSARMVREWLLLLLRFAVTGQPSDRLATSAMAEQLDSLGTRRPPGAAPRFFRRTSEEVCRAIIAAGDGRSNAVLRKHIARIDDPRLRRAFQAAVGIAPTSRSSPSTKRDKRRKNQDLWKGLPSR